MTATTDKLNIILIGNDIETRIVFKNALSKLDRLFNIGDYYCLDKAMTNPNQSNQIKPDIIFLDTNSTADCSNEIRKIRKLDGFRDCSLIVYDSNCRLRDTNGIFSEGADAFINQPYDFPRLKKIIGDFVNLHWHTHRLEGNKQPYFL